MNKTKMRVMAAALAVVMAVVTILASSAVEVKAADINKAMEIKVDFKSDAKSGDDSSILFDSLLYDDEVSLGKTYAVNMKFYVPAAFMKQGKLSIKPYLYLWEDKNMQKVMGIARSSSFFDYKVKSQNVTKLDDFYTVDIKIPFDIFIMNGQPATFPEGKGVISVDAFVIGFNQDYMGSIYVDDVALVVDDKVVSFNDYENDSVGKCSYQINVAKEVQVPEIVSFDIRTLNVSKAAFTVKKGKIEKIKATTTPEAKITYKSSNKKIATVTNKGVVKGIKKGKTTITVKANGKTVKVKVTVK